MIETIGIQSIWSPPGKEFPKVITTPEKVKYHLYEEEGELSQYLKVGSAVTVDYFPTQNRQGKDIRKIQNIITEGKPILQQVPEKPVAQKKYGRDEDRTDQRTFVMEVGQDLRAKLIDKEHPFAIARKAIMTSWIPVGVELAEKSDPEPTKLAMNMDWLKESIKKIWETNKAFVQFLVDEYQIPMGGSVKDMLEKLTQEQQADLCQKIEKKG